MVRFAAFVLISIASVRCDFTEKRSDDDDDDWGMGSSSDAPPSLFGDGESGGSGGSTSGTSGGTTSGESGSTSGGTSGGESAESGGTSGGESAESGGTSGGESAESSGTSGGTTSGESGGASGGGSDGIETADDVDGDGFPSWEDCDDTDPYSSVLATDADCDSILNVDESDTDSDGDGTMDYLDTDADGDGIADSIEAGDTDPDTTPFDTDDDGVPDYLDEDSDDDGISDTTESGVDDPGEEPRDTDGDGRYDFVDTDADGDTISDGWEVGIHGTDPYDADTDGDDIPDGAEVVAGTDPLDVGSVFDGRYIEVPAASETEATFLFTLSIQRADVAFLLDTTGSMGSTVDAMASEFSGIVSDLSPILPDVQYGFATYDDYAFGSFGSASYGDKPFILRQQITDNTDAVEAEITSAPLHGGADLAESTMEALYQGATGIGYDQNCDGVYESTTDVRPFRWSADDPFRGAGGESFSSLSSGGGEIGGFGFRSDALPILIYATDNALRDPDAGYGTPGGCPSDAGQSDVVDALSRIGGRTIGIMTGSGATDQMIALAIATDSVADTDGDGTADDALVFNWAEGSDSAFRRIVVGAIEDLVDSVTFSRVDVRTNDDAYGFVTDIVPPFYGGIEPGAEYTFTFTVSFEGVVEATTESQLYRLTLHLVGDGATLLDSVEVIVSVPGISE